MSIFETSGPAVPLTADDVEELRHEGLAGLIVEVDGELYCDGDLFHCASCGLRVRQRAELDDDLLCDTCAAEAREEMDHLQRLRRAHMEDCL